MAIEKVNDGLDFSDKESTMLFRVDKTATVGVSKSGKMTFIANTHGWVDLGNGYKMNCMIGKSNKQPKQPNKMLKM